MLDKNRSEAATEDRFIPFVLRLVLSRGMTARRADLSCVVVAETARPVQHQARVSVPSQCLMKTGCQRRQCGQWISSPGCRGCVMRSRVREHLDVGGHVPYRVVQPWGRIVRGRRRRFPRGRPSRRRSLSWCSAPSVAATGNRRRTGGRLNAQWIFETAAFLYESSGEDHWAGALGSA